MPAFVLELTDEIKVMAAIEAARELSGAAVRRMKQVVHPIQGSFRLLWPPWGFEMHLAWRTDVEQRLDFQYW